MTAASSALCVAPRCMALRGAGSAFCASHALAPAGRRGGWLSQYRKRTVSGVTLDASNITRRLWIGGEPPVDRDLPDFDVLVLCAQEIQPHRPELRFHGLTIHCPLPDAMLSHQELCAALMGGKRVAEELHAGKRVLVTCAMGRNRSALVAGLGMGRVYRLSAPQIMEVIRQKRHPDCLSNPYFVKVMNKFIVRQHP